MFQPFEELKPNYIRLLEQQKKNYLVSQSYGRGFDPLADVHRIDILMTDYDDEGLAKIHYNAVKEDKYAAILKLDNPKHKDKLEEMLHEGSKYHVFWGIIKSKSEVKDRILRKFKENIRRYVNQKTNWRIGGDKEIVPDIAIDFGELFITLKYGRYQDIRVKFEEIERI